MVPLTYRPKTETDNIVELNNARWNTTKQTYTTSYIWF